MKYIIFIVSLLNLTGCANLLGVANTDNFVVRDTNSKYGMKYHFILQTNSKISDMHNPFAKHLLVTHYHIYTNKLGKVSGDKILFAEHDYTQPKPLSKNSTFIFNKNSVTIKGLQWCATVISHCEPILNGNYFIKHKINLKPENYSNDDIMDKGYYK